MLALAHQILINPKLGLDHLRGPRAIKCLRLSDFQGLLLLLLVELSVFPQNLFKLLGADNLSFER